MPQWNCLSGCTHTSLHGLSNKLCRGIVTRLHELPNPLGHVVSMVFLILVGASVFSLVFRGFGGDELVEQPLQLPGGVVGAMLVVMLVMFLLGFVLDFIEITFVVVPIVGPSCWPCAWTRCG